MKADNEIESPDTINNKRQTHIPMPSELAPTPMVEDILNDERVPGEAGAQSLLASSPKSYMYNQIYGLWFFASLFILVTIITHKVSTEQYGILAVIMTAYNTILYIVSFGLEDAITTYVPRVFAEYGNASAGFLIRKLLLLRVIMLIVCTVILLFSLPLLANVIALLPINGVNGVANGLRDTQLLITCCRLRYMC